MPSPTDYSPPKSLSDTSKNPWLIASPAQLGQAVRAGRHAMGLTQPRLALAAGCGLRFIVDLEAGKSTVRLENVLRVIEALGAHLQLNNPNARAPQQQDGQA